MKTLFKVSNEFTDETYQATTQELKDMAIDLNEQMYNESDHEHDKRLCKNKDKAIRNNDMEVIKEVLESANIYIDNL